VTRRAATEDEMSQDEREDNVQLDDQARKRVKGTEQEGYARRAGDVWAYSEEDGLELDTRSPGVPASQPLDNIGNQLVPLPKLPGVAPNTGLVLFSPDTMSRFTPYTKRSINIYNRALAEQMECIAERYKNGMC
jgi:hypothetical protein